MPLEYASRCDVLLNVLTKHAYFVYAKDWKTASKCMHVHVCERESMCVYA